MCVCVSTGAGSESEDEVEFHTINRTFSLTQDALDGADATAEHTLVTLATLTHAWRHPHGCVCLFTCGCVLSVCVLA